MSIASNVAELAEAVGLDVGTVWGLINNKAADLSDLDTTSKANLVAAINEVRTIAIAAGGSGTVSDDAGNQITVGSDGGLYVGLPEYETLDW
jgi:hypothetical protein